MQYKSIGHEYSLIFLLGALLNADTGDYVGGLTHLVVHSVSSSSWVSSVIKVSRSLVHMTWECLLVTECGQLVSNSTQIMSYQRTGSYDYPPKFCSESMIWVGSRRIAVL